MNQPDNAAAARGMIALAEERLDPLWKKFRDGADLVTWAVHFGQSDSAEAYVRASGLWLSQAQRITGTNDPDPAIDALGDKIDDVVAKRTGLMTLGYGLKNPASAAVTGFVDEFKKQLEELLKLLKKITIGISAIIGAVAVLYLIILFKK